MTQQLGLFERDTALDLLERTRADWISRARVVAHNIILRKGWVTA